MAATNSTHQEAALFSKMAAKLEPRRSFPMHCKIAAAFATNHFVSLLRFTSEIIKEIFFFK